MGFLSMKSRLKEEINFLLKVVEESSGGKRLSFL